MTFASVYGLVLAWLAIQTGGLEAGIALHTVGNVTRFLVLLGTGYDGDWMNDLNSEASWSGVAVNGVVQVVTALVIVRLARRAPALRTVRAV
jgi:CAAX protease family protein